RDTIAAGDVFDDHAAPERRRHSVCEQPGQRIGGTTGGERHHEPDVLRWISPLRPDLLHGQQDDRRGHTCDDFSHWSLPYTDCFCPARADCGSPDAISIARSSSRKDSDLPWPSRPRLALTPPSSTSSRTKLKAASFGRSKRTTRVGLRAAKISATRATVTCAAIAA